MPIIEARCHSCRKKIGPSDPMSIRHDKIFCSFGCLEDFVRGRPHDPTTQVSRPVDDHRQPRRAWRP